MTALVILLCIIAFFAILLSFHIKLYIIAGSDIETRLRAGFGPIVLTLSPKKKKKVKLSDFTYEKHLKRLEKEKALSLKKQSKKKNRKKSKATEIKEKADSAAENNTPEAKLFSVFDIIEFVLDEFPRLASYIKIRLRSLKIVIGGDDAAKIAETYGVVKAIVSLFIELLENKTDLYKISEGEVTVYSDFLLDKTKFNLDISLKIRLFSILRTGVRSVAWLVRMKIRSMKKVNF